LGRFYARVFGGGRGSVFSGDRPEFDLATDIATAPPRENDDGGRPYVARNASLNRRTLAIFQPRTGSGLCWFREDLERLFGLLEAGNMRPRVAERISFDEVAEAHRRLEAGGLEGKLVLCTDLPS
jgi:Zinc-binding dehydrogenase